jgi:hypothetical protein
MFAAVSALVDSRRRAALYGNEVGAQGCARPRAGRGARRGASTVPASHGQEPWERSGRRRAQQKRRHPRVGAVAGIGEDGGRERRARRGRRDRGRGPAWLEPAGSLPALPSALSWICQGQGRRRWRALDLGTTCCFLEADAPRVECTQHGVVVAAVPWARHDAWFTRSFEDTAAWLVVNTSKTAICHSALTLADPPDIGVGVAPLSVTVGKMASSSCVGISAGADVLGVSPVEAAGRWSPRVERGSPHARAAVRGHRFSAPNDERHDRLARAEAGLRMAPRTLKRGASGATTAGSWANLSQQSLRCPSRCAYGDPAEVQETRLRDHCDALKRSDRRIVEERRPASCLRQRSLRHRNQTGSAPLGQSSVVLTSIEAGPSCASIVFTITRRALTFSNCSVSVG